MSREEANRNRIIEAAISVFNSKGAKFTMDDVAATLSMSKKTLYKYFAGKDELVMAAIDSGFKAVKEAEKSIYDDPNMDIVEKIRRIIIAIPDKYQATDWRRLYEFKDTYPEAFARIAMHIESGWDSTLSLIEEGIKQGRIRDLKIPVIKCMIESSFESFIKSAALMEAGIGYTEALAEMIDIVMGGICKSDLA